MNNPIHLSPEAKQYRAIQQKTEKVHRETLRRRLEIRLRKAEEKDNRQLLAQLQRELKELE